MSNAPTKSPQYEPRTLDFLRSQMNDLRRADFDYRLQSAIAATNSRIVPRQPSLDPISDAIRDHYLAQARAADQVRRVIAASTRPMDEDDGA